MPRPGVETALEQAPYDPRLARRMLGYLRPYRGLILLAVLLALLHTFAMLGFDWLGKFAIDTLTCGYEAGAGAGREEAWGRFMGILPWLVAAPVAAAATMFGQVLLVQYVGQYAMYGLRRDLFTHLQRLSVSFFDRRPVGQVMTRVTNDVETLNHLLSFGIVTALADVFTLVGIVALMLYQDWRLALVLVFGVGPVMALSTNLFRVFAREAFRDTRRTLGDLNACLQENITGMRVVQAFGREPSHYRRFERLNDLYRKANYRTVHCFGAFFAVVEWIGAMSGALILWYGGARLVQDAITVGGLFLFIRLSEQAFRPVRDLSEKFNMLQSGMAAGERIFGLLDEKPEIEPPDRPVSLGERIETIEFEDVWFAYQGAKPREEEGESGADGDATASEASAPGDAEPEPALRGVSFRVERGQTVALVGATGSGKTTILSLLLRFYDVTRGRVLVNGVDTRELDPVELRARMAIVLQDVFLFNDTVAGNIRMGDEDLSDERVRRAAETVNAAGFIEAFDDGYAHEVRERGATLSVGQKQLLAFARALAFDPEVLILDEATASVDTETERLIQDALSKLFAGRTSLVVAHRLSTIQRADQILVMSHGRIVERGDHQALLKTDGVYRRLYDLQYGLRGA